VAKTKQHPNRKKATVADKRSRPTKKDKVLRLLEQPKGATIPELMEATGWQGHSVRGFLAGTVKRKLGMALDSAPEEGRGRVYRITSSKR